jgi:PST family polysaccharide transporter
VKILLNFFYLTLSKGFGLILFTLITPLLISRIGLESYGTLSICMAFGYFFESITEYSFNITCVNDIVEFKNDQSKISKLFSSVVFAKTFLFCLVLLFYLILIFFVDKYDVIKLYILLTIGYVISRTYQPIWYFISIEKMYLITFFSVISKILYFFFVYIFIHSSSDLYFIIILWGLSEFIVMIMSMIYVILIDKIILELNFKQSLDLLKRDFKFALSFIINRLYIYIPMVLVGYFISDLSAGIYSVADKIITIVKDSISTLFSAALPKVSNVFKNDKIEGYKFINIIFFRIILVYSLFFLSLILFSEDIIFFFTKQNMYQIKVLILLLSISSFILLLRVPASFIVVIRRLDFEYLVSLILGVVTFVLFPIVFFKEYTLFIFALGVIFSELIMTVYLSYYYIVEKKIHVNEKF